MTTFDQRTPIYRQIADRIQSQILRGELGPEDPVPSTNQYAAFHRINPATVAKAFTTLVDAGVLYKKRGIGMFVCPDAHERLRGDRRERFVADVLEPMVAEARMVGIPLDEVVTIIEKLGQEEPA